MRDSSINLRSSRPYASVGVASCSRSEPEQLPGPQAVSGKDGPAREHHSPEEPWLMRRGAVWGSMSRRARWICSCARARRTGASRTMTRVFADWWNGTRGGARAGGPRGHRPAREDGPVGHGDLGAVRGAGAPNRASARRCGATGTRRAPHSTAAVDRHAYGGEESPAAGLRGARRAREAQSDGTHRVSHARTRARRDGPRAPRPTQSALARTR